MENTEITTLNNEAETDKFLEELAEECEAKKHDNKFAKGVAVGASTTVGVIGLAFAVRKLVARIKSKKKEVEEVPEEDLEYDE